MFCKLLVFWFDMDLEMLKWKKGGKEVEELLLGLWKFCFLVIGRWSVIFGFVFCVCELLVCVCVGVVVF